MRLQIERDMVAAILAGHDEGLCWMMKLPTDSSVVPRKAVGFVCPILLVSFRLSVATDETYFVDAGAKITVI